jgi:hypothetical protein
MKTTSSPILLSCYHAVLAQAPTSAPNFHSPERFQWNNGGPLDPPQLALFKVPYFYAQNEVLRYASASEKSEELKRQKQWYLVNKSQSDLDQIGLAHLSPYDINSDGNKPRRWNAPVDPQKRWTDTDYATDDDIRRDINFTIRSCFLLEIPSLPLSISPEDVDEFARQNGGKSVHHPELIMLFRVVMGLILMEHGITRNDCPCVPHIRRLLGKERYQDDDSQRTLTTQLEDGQSDRYQPSQSGTVSSDGKVWSDFQWHLTGGGCPLYPPEGRLVQGCFDLRCCCYGNHHCTAPLLSRVVLKNQTASYHRRRTTYALLLHSQTHQRRLRAGRIDPGTPEYLEENGEQHPEFQNQLRVRLAIEAEQFRLDVTDDAQVRRLTCINTAN